VIKAPPTLRLLETDEFGLVVHAEQVKGAVQVTLDRVDSLTGDEGQRVAQERGADYSNDHLEVNDSPRTRDYVLAADVVIWRSNPSDVAHPTSITVDQWLAYLRSVEGHQALYHLDVEGGRVIGVEQQYFP
jgi:hypothetical protein